MTQEKKPNKMQAPAGWPERFIAELALCGNVTYAAKVACVTRKQAYERRDGDEGFAAAWAEAMEEAADHMEEEARRRAVDGVPEPVFFQGLQVGFIRRYSDNLLMFKLKGVRPEKYRERFDAKHSGSVNLVWDLPVPKMSPSPSSPTSPPRS